MNTFDQFSTRRDVEMLFMESRLTGEEESVSSVSLFIRTGFSLTMVKVNPKRKVFRLTNDSGRELYLKLFAPRKFPLNFLRNAAAKEYTIAKELEKASISVVRYLLWGKGRNNCTFTVSEGVKEPVSAREFFFSSLIKKDRESLTFFRKSLNHLISSLYEKNFLHPDFHTGNVIFSRKEKKMYLLDPWGIRETFFFTKKARIYLCDIWRELYDFLTDDLIISDMVNASLCRKKIDCLSVFEKSRLLREKMKKKHEKKLHKKILNGHYRFTTRKEEEDGVYLWRHTFWHTPPEKFEIDPSWEVISFATAEEAEKSFLFSIDHPAEERIAVLMIRKKTGENLLYYTENICKEYLQDKNQLFSSLEERQQ